MNRLMIVVAAAALVGPAAHAAEVEIVSRAGLAFGSLVPLGAGTITVPASGFVSYAGIAPVGGRTGAAQFEIRGDPSALVEVRLPGSPIPLRSTFGQGALHDFTIEPLAAQEFAELGDGRYRLRLDASGTASIAVGATLRISALGPEGLVTAAFPVAVRHLKPAGTSGDSKAELLSE